MEKDLITQAKENEARIKVLGEERRNLKETGERETYRIKWDVYEPKIDALKRERDDKVGEVQRQAEAAENLKTQEIIELNKPILQVKRILEFLKLDNSRNLTIDDEDIHGYRDRHIEGLGYFFDDNFLKVKLYIIENDKPKNKYSLVAYGKCLFGEDLLKLIYSYGLPGYTHGRYELQAYLKDFPTIEETKTWLQKNRDKLELSSDYETVKREYLEVIEQHKIKDFEEFIFIKCPCGFFFTTFDRENYASHYWVNATCPRCNLKLEVTMPDAS